MERAPEARTLIHPRGWFKQHPAYIELNLAVAPVQLAALAGLGEFAFKDPLIATRQGVIIDGYARKEYADKLGVPTLSCVELDVSEEEALQMILNKHSRSSGWNDYNRIRLAARLGDVIRTRARANQKAGGHFKGSSKLTEANVRNAIAKAAGVSEGNVSKVDHLRNSDSEVLKALANGEIRIHRAWLWRALSLKEQREQLRVFQLKRRLTRCVKTKALAHQGNEPSRVSWTAPSRANAELIARKLLPNMSINSAPSEITIGVLNTPGKAVLLSTELFQQLVERERAI